jgi:TonB family protein
MRCVFAFALASVFACLPVSGQNDPGTISLSNAGLTAPVVLPSATALTVPKHCEELNGMVRLAATIDSAGHAQGLKVLEASDRRLADFATEVIQAQRFKPATLNGSPQKVDVELSVGLHTCAQRDKHATDENLYQFTLRAHPLIGLAVAVAPAAREAVAAVHTQAVAVEQMAANISAPVPTLVKDPGLPVSKKLARHGLCFLAVTVDANGVPQNIHVFHGLEPELDSNAMEAAKQWRFKPALRDGHSPVAVEGTIAATFRYVEKQPVAFEIFIPQAPELVLASNSTRDKELPELEATNADEVFARYKPKNRVPGLCLVSVMVDQEGVPQNAHIVKGLDSSLDEDTVAMVEHLRFKPAMRDGNTPASVWVMVPVRYHVNTWKNYVWSVTSVAALLYL